MLVAPATRGLVNFAQPITRGLEMALLLNGSGVGRSADSSGHGHDVTVETDVTWEQGGLLCPYDAGLVTVPDSDRLTNDHCTIVYYLDWTGGALGGTWLTLGGKGTLFTNIEVALLVKRADTPNSRLYINGGSKVSGGFLSLPTGPLVVVIRIDGTNAQVFYGGALARSIGFATAVTNTVHPYAVTSAMGVTYYFDGTKYAEYYWSRALSDAEIQQISSDPWLPTRAPRSFHLWTPAGGGTTVPLSGTITGTASPSGDLTVTKSLSGTITGTATPSGNLTTGAPQLAGTITGTASPSGNLTVSKALSGTITGTASPSGNLTTPEPALVGTITGTASPSGNLTVSRFLSGTITGTASMTGVLSGVTAPIVRLAVSSEYIVRFKVKDPL